MEKYKKANKKAAYKDMRDHILKSRKFRGHPIVTQLLAELKPVPKEEPKEEVKETKTDGKKSKR